MAKTTDTAALIRATGRRVTNARLTVASVLQDARAHMTVAEVLEAVSKSAAHIDQSTVYRVLADLRDAGIVAESQFNPGESTFEWIAGASHHHLHCSSCSRTFGLDDDLVRRFLSAVSRRHDFSPDAPHMVLSGLCAECSAK